MKQGQIAHLDRNSSNDSEENLAFLCLEHHDAYDSRTSQSKGFTIEEVKQFRKELDVVLRNLFSAPISVGGAEVIPYDPSGHYIRNDGYESADLRIRRMANGQYHIQGLALWGTKREYGPNIGELDFIADLRGDTIQFTKGEYRFTLRFEDRGLRVSEEHWSGMFGINVQFAGEYSYAG